MNWIYIIYSVKLDCYYIGYTTDLDKRLVEHNSGISTITSKASDWKLLYTERFETKKFAHKRELEIKRKKSRKVY
jgi:putative endonuclease